jgi:hypothetical protein
MRDGDERVFLTIFRYDVPRRLRLCAVRFFRATPRLAKLFTSHADNEASR